MIGPVPGHLDRPRVERLEDDRLAAGDEPGTDDAAGARREDVLAEAGGVDERLHQRVGRKAGQRVVGARRAGEVAPVEPDHAGPGRPAGSQAVSGTVGPDRVTVGQPDVVVRRGAILGTDRRDTRSARMAQQQLVEPDPLAGGRPRPLLQAQSERLEPELRVAHEREERRDVRQPGRELGDLGSARSVGGGGEPGSGGPGDGCGHARHSSVRIRAAATPDAPCMPVVGMARWGSRVDSGTMEIGHRVGTRDVTTHVAANGLAVAFHAEGSGPPLVLLHGASSAGRDDFAAQLPRFVRTFRCYLPDARGHAGTRWDPAPGLRYADLVEDLDAFADACNLGTFHLLGFSMGAATALLYAIRSPERLRTLVLVGTSPELEPRTRVIRHLADVARIDAQDPAWAAALARRHDPVQGPGAWRRLMPAIIEMVEQQPVVPAADLRRVEVPTLVVVGDRDPFVPVPQAWQLSRQLPQARLAVIPGAGHEAMAGQPGIFNEACASFWRSAETAAAGRSARRVAGEGRGAAR